MKKLLPITLTMILSLALTCPVYAADYKIVKRADRAESDEQIVLSMNSVSASDNTIEVVPAEVEGFTKPATLKVYNESGVTVQQNYVRNEYVLTVDPNNGTWNNSTATQTFKQKYKSVKNIPDPTRIGYTFTGWTLTGGGKLTK